jgi:lipoprotein-anchoring transpeptidase ErfK/SrfK
MLHSSNSSAALAVAATVLAAWVAGSPPPAQSSTPKTLYSVGSEVGVPHRGVTLLHAAPGSQRVLARIGPRTVFGSPVRLAVVGTSGEWLAVISAALGNRVRGFVHTSKVRLLHVPVSLEVDRSSRWLRVWRMGEVLRTFEIAVGAFATPTPRGRFAITDKLSNFMPSIYGCCTLALSGHQTRLAPGWTGGDRLAIHAGSGIGSAVSNGCLRAAETDMRYLMELLPLGTQVVVHD